ncbi:MAG: hypothetical protein KF721_00495 [Ignavibacteriaceae bacterium]|nr:hypothetical protein [Ignavibacteriaceae bacterium]
MTDSENTKCGHACKNSCAMLNEALRKETASVRFYEGVFDQCHSPEIRNFLGDLIDERRGNILRIIQKLNEIHARSQSIDGMIASFTS